MPKEILQAVRQNGRYFAKRGLEVRAGAVVEISVAPEARRYATIGWGSPGRPGTTQRVNGCAVLGCTATAGSATQPSRADCGWLAFAGGYRVDAPACVPLVIRSAGREARADIAAGAACE